MFRGSALLNLLLLTSDLRAAVRLCFLFYLLLSVLMMEGSDVLNLGFRV
jgi:hypothetical protein